MSGNKSLKAQNAWLVNGAVLAHMAAFALVISAPLELHFHGLESWLVRLRTMLAPGAISLVVVVLISLILRGLMPAIIRDRLIHWRWEHPLPGARAFSEIGPLDGRINMEELNRRYGPLPVDAESQNREFYKIYHQYRDATGVLDAHKSYLSARDIAVITFFFALTLPLTVYLITGDSRRSLTYEVALLAVFLCLSLAAKGYGRRLVENTLTVASHAPTPASPRSSSRKKSAS